MARIELKKGAGPSPWHIMLAGFDTHPANAHGIRTLDFTLANGLRFQMALKGIDWGEYPSLDPWTLYGYQVNLPKGYYYADHEKRVVEVKFDPYHKTGEVELELVSPCHMATIGSSLGDGVLIGHCSECNESVLRVNPRTGTQEWLDGESPWTMNNRLRPVGVKSFKKVWITYVPPQGDEQARFIVDALDPEENHDHWVNPDSLVEMIPGALWVDRPAHPSMQCPSYYVLRGTFSHLTEDQQVEFLGEQVAYRLRIAETYEVNWDHVPVELGEDMPILAFPKREPEGTVI